MQEEEERKERALRKKERKKEEEGDLHSRLHGVAESHSPLFNHQGV